MATNGHMAPHLVHDSEPGWQKRAVEGVEGTQSDDNVWMRNISVRASWKFWSLAKIAARQRGICMQGYIRRAVAAFMVRDLGMSWEEITSLCPVTFPFNQNSPEAKRVLGKTRDAKREGVRLRDDGEGYGDWNIWD